MSAAAIRNLSSALHSATAALVRALAPFLEGDEWKQDGISSPEHWLSLNAGFEFHQARRLVELARALPAIPLIEEAFAAGELSLQQVRSVAAVATPADQQQWLDIARTAAAPQLQRITQAYAERHSAVGPQLDARRRARRRLVTFWTDDGMLKLIAELPPEDGAVVLAALERTSTPSAEPRSKEQARADSLVAVCRQEPTGESRPATLMVHVDANVLTGKTTEGRCHIDRGPAISPALAQRLGCDANIIRLVEKDGIPINLGRTTRTVSPGLTRACRLRDRGCTFPGCSVPARDCDAHHIEWWHRDDGPTDIENLTLLCTFHHQRVHNLEVHMLGQGGAVRFFDRQHQPIGPFAIVA
jgi:hypothetical protein